jgi:hypothetical protein
MASLLPEIAQDPVVIAVVTLLVFAAIQYQRTLSFTEYRAVMRLKRRLFPILDRLAPFGFTSFVHEKQLPDEDAEYLTTLSCDARTLWSIFVASGWSPHLVASTKRRPDGVSWYHFVGDLPDGRQQEVYTFRTASGWDVYGHAETDAVDVTGHLSDGIEPGDPEGVVGETLRDA